jgi:hypothetical protein
VWEYLIVLVIAAVVSYALAPKPPQPTPPAIDDITVPVAEDGKPVPVVFGEVWITGANVLWYGDLSTTAIRKSSGKK